MGQAFDKRYAKADDNGGDNNGGGGWFGRGGGGGGGGGNDGAALKNMYIKKLGPNPVSTILFCCRRFIRRLELPLTRIPIITIGWFRSSVGRRSVVSEPAEVHIRIASVCGLL